MNVNNPVNALAKAICLCRLIDAGEYERLGMIASGEHVRKNWRKHLEYAKDLHEIQQVFTTLNKEH